MGIETRFNTGKLIRAARKKIGLSQTEVASLANVSRRTVQNIESGNGTVKSTSVQAVGDVLHLDLQVNDTLVADETITNVASFGYWPFRMFKFVSARITPSEFVFCDREKDFLSMLEILWENFQHGLSNFSPNKALRAVEIHPQFFSRAGYFSRYLGIWRANPQAFCFSSVKGRRTGVSIVLPVSESTFTEFVEGRLRNFDLQGSEILPQSPKVIYESIAPFFDSRDLAHPIGESLAFVAMHQLSLVLPYVRTERCDIASFSAHQENTQRMRSVGLAPVGTKVPGLDFPVWQVSNCLNSKGDEDTEIRSSTMLHYLSLRQTRLSFRAKMCFNAIGALQANHMLGHRGQRGTNAA